MLTASNVRAAPDFGSSRVRTGVDIVQISRIEESLRWFGERFIQRLFTAAEVAYAGCRPELAAQRYAARFAAKEAALKAFDLTHSGINWRDIEVVRAPGGACHLQLHGKAARLAAPLQDGGASLSLSHDGDYAIAVVFALRESATSH
jgi:holo-[acyl-carrier protein] synthase